MIDDKYMVDFTFQREWVERRGLFLVLAFYLGGLGGGLYLVSLYQDFYLGMIVGFLTAVAGKGICHLIYLGRPWRFWRGFLKPQSSWISRGLITVAGFAVFSAMQLAPGIPQLSWLPWATHNGVIQTLVVFSAIVLIAYTGFALGVVNAIPFWNTALLPLLFIACSLLGGFGLTLALVTVGGYAADLALLEVAVRWLLPITALLIGIHLWIGYHATWAGKRSVLEMLKGRVSPYFIGGVVILGLVLPWSITIITSIHEVATTVLLAGVASELIGGFFVRYSIMKAGIYAPLL